MKPWKIVTLSAAVGAAVGFVCSMVTLVWMVS